MSGIPKFVTKKKVTVTCMTPFRIGLIPYSGICRNVTLTVQDISECLTNHAKVVEILSNGKEIPLDFSNYDTDNGPTDVTEDSEVLNRKTISDPVIEQKNAKGETINTLNKKEVKEEKKVIKVTANIEKEAEVKSDTQSTVKVTTNIDADTAEDVKINADNTTDTKVEVENNKQNNNNSSFQNQKKNKFK